METTLLSQQSWSSNMALRGVRGFRSVLSKKKPNLFEQTPMITEMQEYYHCRAPIYDASMGYDRPDIVSALEPVIDQLRERLKNRDVLEIACGPGFWTQQIAVATRSITATDFNDSTLAEARRKGMDWQKVTLIRADAYNLPSFTRTFDGCLAVDWFCHVPISKRSSFLENLHVHMSDSARIAFCDQLPSATSLTSRFDTEGNHLQERTLPEGGTYTVIKNFPEESELRSVFAPYAREVHFHSFPSLRRYVVEYTLRKG